MLSPLYRQYTVRLYLPVDTNHRRDRGGWGGVLHLCVYCVCTRSTCWAAVRAPPGPRPPPRPTPAAPPPPPEREPQPGSGSQVARGSATFVSLARFPVQSVHANNYNGHTRRPACNERHTTSHASPQAREARLRTHWWHRWPRARPHSKAPRSPDPTVGPLPSPWRASSSAPALRESVPRAP